MENLCNRRFFSLFIVLFLLFISTQSGGNDCFVLLPKIDGQFKIDGEAGWIEVVHFRLCNTIREAIYSDSQSGNFGGGQISLTKQVDDTSNRIMELSKKYLNMPEVKMKLDLPARLSGKRVNLILKHVVIVGIIPTDRISGQAMEKIILDFMSGWYGTEKTMM